MHIEAFRWFQQTLQTLPPRKRVVEIGAKNINGTLRELFQLDPPEDYIGVDIVAGPCVDVVASGAEFMPTKAVDTVLCAEVLEHTDEAAAICANAYRMLEPGGYFLASMATDPRVPHSAIDGGEMRPDEFYRNVTADQLRAWLKPFKDEVRVETHPVHGDLYCVAKKAVRVGR